MPTNWRVYKNNTIAGRLDRGELPGFLRKKIVVGPNEAAIIVQDGEPSQLLTATSFQAANGLDQIKSLFGMGSDISVYFVDLAPFDLSIFLGKTTATAAGVSATGTGSASVSIQSTTSGQIAHTVSASSGGLLGFARRLVGLNESAVDSAIQKIGWDGETDTQYETALSSKTRVDVSQVQLLALSADREVIQAACQMRLKINPENLNHLVGLLRGKQALATWDIEALLRDEWFARVLVPEIALHQSSDLRGNRALNQELERQTRESLAETLESCGLLLENFTLNWGLTGPERAEIEQKKAEREEKALDFLKTRYLAQMGRDQEIEKNRLGNLQELKMAQAKGDQDLQNLLLAGDLNRDLMAKGNQVDTAMVDAQIRDITLLVEKKESAARLEKRRAEEELRLDLEDRTFKQKHAARLASIDADDKEMWSMVKMQIEMATQHHDREMSVRRHDAETSFRKMQTDNEDRYQLRKQKMEDTSNRMAALERQLQIGLAGGANVEVLKTMFEQSTELASLDSTNEMVRARSEAKGTGNNLETYRQAQADERAHQAGQTMLASHLMAAAKQGPAPVVLAGGTGGLYSPQAPLPQPALLNQSHGGLPQALPGHFQGGHASLPAPAMGSGSTCPQCGLVVQAGWKVCPPCGIPLPQPGSACQGCGSRLQIGWKACPACGMKQNTGPKICQGCRSEVQPHWKACPACGNPQ